MNFRVSLSALIAAVAISVAMGMLIGIRIDDPPMALAAPDGPVPELSPPIRVAPALTGTLRPDFADIAEAAIPAVVGITNVRMIDAAEQESIFERFHRFLPDQDDGGDEPEGDSTDPDAERAPRRDDSSGSGFLISEDGYVLSNNHVVDGSDGLTVALVDGTRYSARIVGTDPGIDLALLKIDPDGRKLPFLRLGSSRDLRVGEWVMAIGNPLDFNHSVTVGVVSAKDRHVVLEGTDYGVAAFIQTDAAINLGNSGGPLLNGRGEVIGINTAISRNLRNGLVEGIGFALQVDEARRASEQLLETGVVRRGILGVSMSRQDIDDDARRYYGLPDRNGVLVSEVTAGGPAALAGIESEDIIRRIEGDTIRTNDDLLTAIATRRPDDEVEIEVFRDGRTFKTRAQLAERRIDRTGAAYIADDEQQDLPSSVAESRPSGLGLSVDTHDADALSARWRELADPRLRGVIVTAVELNSVAMNKGMTEGMIIVSLNDRPVETAGEWSEIVSAIDPGTTVKLETRWPDGRLQRRVFLTVAE